MSDAVLDKEAVSPKLTTRKSMDSAKLESIAGIPAFTQGPTWWRSAQQQAWEDYSKLPFPAVKDPAWRFGDVHQVNDLAKFHIAPSFDKVSSELAKTTSLEEAKALGTAGFLVFGNDRIIAQGSLSTELSAQGVIFEPLAVALDKHSALLQKHLLKQEASLGSEKFRQLHAARLTNGTFLFIPKGVRVTEPFQIFHWLKGENATIFPHTLVIAEDNAEVTVADFYGSVTPSEAGFSIGVNDLVAGSGAKIHYLSSQRFSPKVVSIQIGNTETQRDAQVKSLNLHLGGHYSRVENKSRLVGAGSRSDMLALTVSQGTEIFDQRTYQDHLAPHTTSDLLYKNALSDESQTIFAGLIRVEPAGQQTNAYQSNRNLLLDPKAEAHSLPGLEILANDVRCTHGSTTGQVEPEQLFYLRQRGIPTSVAQRLLVFGFFQEVLTRFGHEAVTALFSQQIEAKFGK
jgi:Fe-S cluster assembly protein SufD